MFKVILIIIILSFILLLFLKRSTTSLKFNPLLESYIDKMNNIKYKLNDLNCKPTTFNDILKEITDINNSVGDLIEV
jgi:hypothetical protein